MYNTTEITYLENLIKFRNFRHASALISRMMALTQSDEIQSILKQMEDYVNAGEQAEIAIFAPVIVSDNDLSMPLLLPISLNYGDSRTVKLNREIEKTVRRSICAVENFFARKGKMIDINPHMLDIYAIEETDQYNVDCRSAELAFALALYSLITGKKPRMKVSATGALDYTGTVSAVDMIEKKAEGTFLELEKCMFIIPAENKETIRAKSVQTIDEAIENVFGSYTTAIDSRFNGNMERILNIAETFFMKDDYENYLPLFVNLELSLRNSASAREMNIYFITLMRLAMHYNRAGAINNAEKYFKKALKTKQKLIKEELFEWNRASIEFNNILAVFLWDVYKKDEAMDLLNKNIGEKEHFGKHIRMTTLGTLAQNYIQIGQYDIAEKYLLENLDICKQHVKYDISRVYCYLAKLETLRGKYVKAAGCIRDSEKFLKFTNENVQNTYIMFEKIRLYSASGELKKAKEQLNRLNIHLKGSKYRYLYYLAEDFIAVPMLEKNQKEADRHIYSMVNGILKMAGEEFHLFAIRALLKAYLETQENKYLSKAEEIIKELNKYKAFICTDGLSDERKIREFINQINII